MRRIKKILTFSMLILFSTICLASCSLFPNSDNIFPSTEAMIEINFDEIKVEQVVKYNQSVTVEVKNKKEYYLEGIYDEEEGGTKYFDSLGKSLVAWKKEFPTTFYARYGSIYELEQEIEVYGNEPKSCNGNNDSNKYVLYKEYKLDDLFISALNKNFDKKIKVNYSVDLKINDEFDTSYNNKGADEHEVFKILPTTNNFTTYTGSVDISANDFANGNIYVYVKSTRSTFIGFASYFYIRNLNITISFAE